MDLLRPADEPVLREFYKEENFAHDLDEVLDTRLVINELIKHMKM
jgi:hypothetical protein